MIKSNQKGGGGGGGGGGGVFGNLSQKQKIGIGIGIGFAVIVLIIVLYFVLVGNDKTKPPVKPPVKPPDNPPDNPLASGAGADRKLEVYVYDQGIHGIPWIRVSDIARNLNATLATTAQIQEAQKAGADWCRWGWTADYGTIAYPIANNGKYPNCPDGDGKPVGTSGKVVQHKLKSPLTETWAVLLYGIKPKLGIEVRVGDPVIDGEQPECKSVFGAQKIFGSGCVLPFSSTKWSQYTQ
jgi:hypothetical protein